MNLARLAILLLAHATVACTGMTFGENAPGRDTYVDTPEVPEGQTASGSIAIDQRTETIYLQQSRGSNKHLLAVEPDSGRVDEVANLTGRTDTRILFPKDRVLVMSEEGGLDILSLYDANTHELVRERKTDARYHGTRTSATGRHVAVADGVPDGTAPIHLIDAETLQAQVILHDGFWLEAMWLNQSDELYAIVFYDEEQGPSARLLSWRLEDLSASEYGHGPDGLWLSPKHDIALPGARPDFLFSFTWVGVAPDDSKVVIPLQRGPDDGPREHYLAVFDTETEEVDEISNSWGPVGFTPDSSTIVSYRYLEDAEGEPAGTALVLIDTETYEETELEIPTTSLPNFFTTREGNFVVVASAIGEAELMLFDVDNQTQTQLEGPQITLREFVSRLGQHELWLVDGGLFRLDFLAGHLAEVSLAWLPKHINILPIRDLLVLDDSGGDTLYLYDPEQGTVLSTISLSSSSTQSAGLVATSRP